jgi:cell wall-associated NlpC family hydrolase
MRAIGSVRQRVVVAVLLLCGFGSLHAVADDAPRSAAAERPSPVVDFAKTLLGVPYRWGGSLPQTGFDCSGFVQYVFRQLETFVPRSAADLYRQTQRVSVNALEPGDVLFFGIRSGPFSHVAIYLGDGKFIHAPRRGEKVSIGRLDAPYYRSRLTGAGRVMIQSTDTAHSAERSLSR